MTAPTQTIRFEVLRDTKKGDYLHVDTVLALLEAKLPPQAYARAELEIRRTIDKALR